MFALPEDDATMITCEPGASNDHKRPFDSNCSESKESCCTHSSDKRLKSSPECQIHKLKFKSTDKPMREAIRKWQMCNFAKCMFDNTVNLVFENIPPNDESVREIAINIGSQNYHVENEAVLMAIEEHGLKQPGSCSCSDSDKSSDSSEDDTNSGACSSSSADFYVQRMSTLSSDFSNESLEYNFENNFMTTAVSAAIEEKGLSMYHAR